jgi:mannose-1-phosphate guanylyltransferase/mannose-6-phosphate isomerase
MNNLYALILAGGSGTRLWPWSREELPKQFLALAGKESLFQQTVRRLSLLVPPSHLYIAASSQWGTLLRHQMRQVSEFSHDPVIVEPMARNTCAAIALGLTYILEHGASPEDSVFVSPSDHVIKDEDAFAEALKRGYEASKEGYLVTFGIPPTRPDTGFGYIQVVPETSKSKGYLKVSHFVEKPDEHTAKAYLEDGNYLWNGGFFLFQINKMLEALKEYMPEVGEAASEGYENLCSRFEKLPSISIDYAVMEKAKDIVAVPLEAGWSDIGSWDTLYEALDKDEDRNVKCGDVELTSSEGNLVFGNNRLIVGLNISDLIIADTPDALLVAKRGSSQGVRDVVSKLKEEKRREATEASINVRPWGMYQILHQGDRFKIKRIVIEPGARLSLQYHHHRSEHWVVVRGTALAKVGDEERFVHEGESIFVSKSTLHRLSNPGKLPLEIIEVQNGEYVGEDDIVRIEDDFKRNER